MINIVERNPKGTHYRCLTRGQEEFIPCEEINAKLGVVAAVRIWNEEYDKYLAPAHPGKIVRHYNPPLEKGELGQRVVLARIIKNGYVRSKSDWLAPLLSFQKVWVSFEQRCDTSFLLEQLTTLDFENAIGDIHDLKSLKRVLGNRYRDVLRGFPEKEFLAKGVAIREFRLEQIVSLSDF